MIKNKILRVRAALSDYGINKMSFQYNFDNSAITDSDGTKASVIRYWELKVAQSMKVADNISPDPFIITSAKP